MNVPQQPSVLAPREPVYRAFDFGVTRALRRDVGAITYLRCDQDLLAYPVRMSDRLLHWAAATPDQPLFAQRDPARGGEWRSLSFAQALHSARAIGQALLDRGLNAERPLAILCENSLEHAMLALGAMVAGVPFCAVSPAYSLISQDHAKLRHVLQTLTPGLIYVGDWDRFGRPVQACVGPDIEVVLVAALPAVAAQRKLTPLSDLLSTAPTAALDAAMQASGPDTIVKFLFTSGSTKAPKAVINTQRMICANQQQMRQSMPFLAEEPPILVICASGMACSCWRARQRHHATRKRRRARRAGAKGRDRLRHPARPGCDRLAQPRRLRPHLQSGLGSVGPVRAPDWFYRGLLSAQEKGRIESGLFLACMLVERRRIELPTFALRTRRSPS